MQVDARVRPPEQPVLEPVGLADAEDVAGRFERRDVRLLVGRVRDGERDVDDRLRREPGHRGRADVLHLQRARAERVADPVGLVPEELRPVGVVLREQNRPGEELRLADRDGAEPLVGIVVARVRERVDRRKRVASKRARAPGVAAVAALPELPVGQSGEEAAVGGDERVRHRGQRLGQPAAERLPRLSVAAPVDARLRLAAAVRGEGAGARGDVPALGIVGVDCDRPRVVAVAAVVRALPRLPRVHAERGAAAARLVRAARLARVPGERVHVRLRVGAVVLPGVAAVGRAHEPAELDADEEQLRVVRAGRDPADVRRPRPRREAPRRPRRKLEQRVERVPALAAVVAAEEPARLGSRVHRAVGRADRRGRRRRDPAGEQSSQLRPASLVRRTPPSRRPA